MNATLPHVKRILMMIAILLSSGVMAAQAMIPQATAMADSCPSGWTCADIGAPTPVGGEALNGNTWTVTGGGWDIWGTADQFHYVWQSLSGDGSLSAHVSAQTNTAASAKAGVMLRQSPDPGAPYYLAAVSPSNGIKIEYRAIPGSRTVGAAYPAGSAPVYLKVVRTGSTLTAYTSNDGGSWSAVPGSSVSLSLSCTLLAGLVVSSMNRTTASTATFDTVQIAPVTAGSTTTPTSTALPPTAALTSTVVRPPKTPVPVVSTAATSTPLAAPAAPADTPAPRGPGGSWHLVFGDEFDGTSLDTTKWNTCYWWAGPDNGCANNGDGSMNYYLSNEVSEGDGLVDLVAQNTTVTGCNGKTYNYVGGMIATNRTGSQTADKFSYTYGYMEIRAKLPPGWGYWPGFWMAASNHSWPPEIDAMEANGGDPHTVTLTIHWPNGTSGGGQDSSNYSDPNVDFTNSYHTFGVDWEPDAVTWYVDGFCRKTFTNSAAIPATPMNVFASLAVNGNPGWAPTSSTAFPGHMSIDYIRVWQKG